MNNETKITEAQMHPSDGMIAAIYSLANGLSKSWMAKADDTRRTNPSISSIKMQAEGMLSRLPALIHELETLMMEGLE